MVDEGLMTRLDEGIFLSLLLQVENPSFENPTKFLLGDKSSFDLRYCFGNYMCRTVLRYNSHTTYESNVVFKTAVSQLSQLIDENKKNIPKYEKLLVPVPFCMKDSLPDSGNTVHRLFRYQILYCPVQMQ